MKMNRFLGYGLTIVHVLLPLAVQGDQLRQDEVLLHADFALVKVLKHLEDADAKKKKKPGAPGEQESKE